MSGNENSEDENNFFSKLKELKERNLSNSPAIRKSPQRQFYTNENELITECAHEGDLEEKSIHYRNNTNTNNNNSCNSNSIGNINNNKRQSWNNIKNNTNDSTKKNLSVNKYSNKNYNTDINNKRFQIDPSEDKRNILSIINRNRITRKNNQKADKAISSNQFRCKSDFKIF
jgi:hypothetical protein